jgi:diguanylate cyclase (GGDEF)-like protein
MVDVANILELKIELDKSDNSPHWLAAQQTLAASTNLALVTVAADNDLQKTVANETSICQSFLTDPAKAPMCAEFCGKARERAIAAGGVITYRCDANLHCFAAPLQVSGKSDSLVLIGGRTFLSVSEYREFLQRETAGGSRPHPRLFSNIKFTEADDFDRHQHMILTTVGEVLTHTAAPEAGDTPSPSPASILSTERLEGFFKGSFEQGCREALHLIGSQFQISSGVLLMRTGRRMAACAAGGERREQLIELHLNPDSLLLRRMQSRDEAAVSFLLTAEELTEMELEGIRAEAFPLFIGEDLTGILLVVETELEDTTRQEIARLSQTLIVPLELARLRDAVSDQTRSLAQWQDFSHLLATRANAPETYSAIVEKVVTALGAERVSLLIYNEDSDKLIGKASSGLGQEILNTPHLGEGIAGVVLERGEPLMVRDLREQSWVAERAHGNAHSHSFISFPLLSGGKRLGVINLTDRDGDQIFTASDLDWLRLFAPYAAAALEKIDLHEKAQRFQLLAITDPLTGLLNRRYLEERFAQEIERSKRYQFPLSFVMMDIDSFKSFNDTFGHQAGDEVLRETAHCIRRSLRNFDVAARYGGEEFIVVLPETDVTSAMILAERLRKAVEQHFTGERSRHPVTVSIGVSSLSKTLQNRHQVIRAADQALYAAKKRGKNCVVVYNTELVPGLA